MNEMPRPLPTPSPDTRPFWDACKRHELTLPYCTDCQQFFFYPRPFCPSCFGWNIEWRQCSGRGVVHTFAIQYRAQMPGFRPPYVTAIVQLEEGPRMMTNLVGIEEPSPENVRCDMPVEVVWEDLSDEITLPMFRPVA